MEEVIAHLQQLPIRRATRKTIKALQSNAFMVFLGLGLSAKRIYIIDRL
ncbi:hypothetical protein APA_225 [Pseudanabaena sp. lw0831]|nr:hypothetical protein APA_225 [Pseudanabaena sp. lw0831]